MQESQTAQSNTGLIYGLNDRPPCTRGHFCCHTAFACYFCSHHHSASYYCRSIETGFGNHKFPGIHGIVRLRHLYLHPMQTHWGYRNRIVMHSRNQLFFYRSHYFSRYAGRAPIDFWNLHCCFFCRNGHQPYLEIYP